MEGDHAELHIKVEVDVNIGDRSGYLDLSDETKLKELEEGFNKVVRSEIEAAFQKSARKFHSDIIAFGNALDDKNPKLWQQVKSRWEDEILPNAELTVEVEGKIRRTSRTLYSPWVQRTND
jgi:spore germination protein KC